MTIKTNKNGNELIMAISGRVDTSTAPEFEAKVRECIEGVTNLVLDFKEVDYISSAGLRVILFAKKAMVKQGDMKIINVNESVYEIFEVTGFSDMLTIETI